MQLQNVAHNTHCTQQNNQVLLNKTAVFQFFKELGLKIPIQSIINDKCSHLVFKLSSTCSHTCSKSLSPLSNCFINYALVQLVPFLSNPAS